MHYHHIRYNGRSAQVVSEYAIFIGIIVVALIAMNTYIQRGLAGNLKDAIDLPMHSQQTLGIPNSFTTNQYEPEYYWSTRQTNHTSTTNDMMFPGGATEMSSNANGTIVATEIIDDAD